MRYDVRVEQVKPKALAVIWRRATPRELSTVVPALCGEVWNFVKAHKIDRPGRHVAVYFDGAINLEVGVEIGATFTARIAKPRVIPNVSHGRDRSCWRR
jgi:hypothetical protein